MIEIWIEGDDLACDWGAIPNPDGQPQLPVHHLMVVTDRYLSALFTQGTLTDRWGNENSLKEVDGRLFFTSRRQGIAYTWELYPAQWRDDPAPGPKAILFIGRWRD